MNRSAASRVLAWTIGFSAGLGLMAAQAQSVFDDVDECDLLAAHPADPQRVADGVADDAIVPRLAMKACEAAVQHSPDELRFAYQLGRAYLAAGRKGEAAGQFERAAGGNYAAAFAAQADLFLSGGDIAQLIKTATPSDIAAAQERLKASAALHAKAVAAGYAASAQQIEAMTFDSSLYTYPIQSRIAEGDIEAAKSASQRPDARAYLYAFATNLITLCGPVLNAATIRRLVKYRFGGAISPEDEDKPSVSIQPLVGEIDAQRFVRRHSCDGPAPQIILFLPLELFLAHAVEE